MHHPLPRADGEGVGIVHREVVHRLLAVTGNDRFYHTIVAIQREIAATCD